jgi:hypothetical protein
VSRQLEAAVAEALRPLVAELVEAEVERRLSELAGPQWLTVEEYAARPRSRRL